jgi:enamine deaminase RidA (YjgF/YER057c/UK114 family)
MKRQSLTAIAWLAGKMRTTVGLFVTGTAIALVMMISPSMTQVQPAFEKKNFNYNEWTKGKFSEVVTVTNPGKFIFLSGVGAEQEGDGKLLHAGNFMEQCRYAYTKIKKLLDLQGATMNDVVRIMTYTTDVRFFPDALKCRGEAFGSAPIPASTFLVVSQLAWPYMAIEIDVMAVLAK